MSMHDRQQNTRYSVLIEWSDEDAAYIATVPELPGCRTHGATRREAVEQAEAVIVGWLDAARAWRRPIPPPRLFAPEGSTIAV